MYKTIYVPVDNSEHSNACIRIAVDLAEKVKAKIVGSHVYAARMHDYRFKQMEYTLPEEYKDETELERQRKIHDSLITMGLRMISDSYLDVLEAECGQRGIPFEAKTFDGKHHVEIRKDIRASKYDLIVMGAIGVGAVRESLIGSVTERVVRKVDRDVLVVRDTQSDKNGGGILVGIDGSPQSFQGLKLAIQIGKALGRKVEAIAVYDPYLHYAMFNGIVDVLSERASKVFRFKEQEQLHEEIIDTGLAKIYQSHLEVARKVAKDDGVDLPVILLDGKVYEKVIQHVRKTKPFLLIVGRIGIHKDEETDIGSNSENLMRLSPCNVLLVSGTFYPPMDVKAEESIQWTEEAEQKMERVPPLVKGIARTAILRLALEKGHSVITSSVIEEAMDIFMPKSAHKAMGDLARKVAATTVQSDERITEICEVCGYAARGESPTVCPVCSAPAEKFQKIDQKVVEAMANAEGGIQIEEAFDGVKIGWSQEARKRLRNITDAYLRRRAKARIEKAARMKRMKTITLEFAGPIIEETVDKDALDRPAEPEAPSPDAVEAGTPKPEAKTGLKWTDEAGERIARVPEGFMRDTAKKAIEDYAKENQKSLVTLEVAEAGIAEARKVMAEVISSYGRERGWQGSPGSESKAPPPKRSTSSWGDLNEVRPPAE
ncbi:MAG: universal stress protein [Planctomycetota bacterium]|nr:universal stress protein [Planctomycetota bacterium]